MAKKTKAPGKSSGKSSFDFQQFLLEKGEKIALSVAGAGLALLAGFGLIAATKAENPGEVSSKLKNTSSAIVTQLATATDVPPKPVMPSDGTMKPISTDDFRTTSSWFNIAGTIVEKRTNPVLLPLIAGDAKFIIGGVGVHDIQGNNIAVIEGKTAVAQNKSSEIKLKKKRAENAKGAPVRPPEPPPAGGPPPGAAPPGKGGGSDRGPPIGQNRQTNEGEVVYMSLDAPQLATAQLARDVQPLRAAVVRGVVPYHDQVKKHMDALRIVNDVALAGAESDPMYKGFIVQRQTVKADGVTNERDWHDLDYISNIKELYRICAEYDVEDPALNDFIPEPLHRLYLPRPKFVRGTYPPTNLQEFAKAKEKMEREGLQTKPLNERQKKLQGQDDIFANRGNNQAGPGAAPGAQPGAGPGPPPKGVMGPPGRNEGPPRGGGGFVGAQPQRNTAVPVWLLQFVDPTIQPGFYYKYRIKLVAMNPNYRRPNDVAQPNLASIEFLESDWYAIDDLVYFPPEEYLYAMTDKAKEKTSFGTDPYDMTTLQFHRWFPGVRVNKDLIRENPIAEWVVADIVAKRGQYVQQTGKAFKVPIWSMAHDRYGFRDRISVSGRPRTFGANARMENIDIDFVPTPRTILVDFEGGKGIYRLPNHMPIIDECANEILLMSEETGEVLRTFSRNALIDKKDPEREAREKAFKDWLDEVSRGDDKPTGAPGTAPPRG